MPKIYNQGMTLKARNNFTLALASIFLAVSTAALVYYLYKLNLLRKGEALFNQEFSLGGIFLWKDSGWTLFFESVFMAAYIPIAAFCIYARFEKTPSNEVAYFMLFLMGCVPELFRLCIPFETVQASYPRLLILAGRALFWGRTLAFISLFAASLIAAESKAINVEQNIFILLLFSLAIANTVPVNTTKVSAAFNIQIGWPLFIYLLYALAALLAFVSCAVNARMTENIRCAKLGGDILCMEAGFLLLNSSAVLAAVVVGAVLLFYGTFRYFYNLHRIYA